MPPLDKYFLMLELNVLPEEVPALFNKSMAASLHIHLNMTYAKGHDDLRTSDFFIHYAHVCPPCSFRLYRRITILETPP